MMVPTTSISGRVKETVKEAVKTRMSVVVYGGGGGDGDDSNEVMVWL